MELRSSILKEHSKNQTAKITRFIGPDKERFAALMKLFLGNEYRVTQRAARVVSMTFENHPSLLSPWLGKIVKNLQKAGLHDAVKRNTLRILQFTDIPVNLQGILVGRCFEFLGSATEPVAVKVFAMTVLLNICKQEPGLKNELKLLIQNQMEHGTAGFKSRARFVMKELERIKEA